MALLQAVRPQPAGNPAFFTEIYQVVNLLQAMAIRAAFFALEVGSGTVWVTPRSSRSWATTSTRSSPRAT